MTTQNLPVEQLPFLYAYGCIASNDATTPNTKLDISAGQVRDSNDNVDILEIAAIINFAVNGFNGLDTGSIGASKMYNIFAISDSSNKNPSGFIASLDTNSQPLMPYGYDSYRLVDMWPTDASSHLLKGYMTGNGNGRGFVYDAPQATAVTAGNATTYTAVDLSNLVARGNNINVSVAFSFTPGAASRTLNLTPHGATGNAVTITGQVTSVVVSGNANVLTRLATAAPEIDYKVANAGDAVALNVAGFSYSI